MKLVLSVMALLLWFSVPVYANQYSNESENPPNKAESTNEAEDAQTNDED